MKCSPLIFIVSLACLLGISYTCESKTITILEKSLNHTLCSEDFKRGADKYILKGDFDLIGNSIVLPENTTIVLNKSSIANGEIHLRNNTSIIGKKGIFFKTRIIGEDVSKILISNILMDGGGATDVDNLFRFMRCININMKNVETRSYYRDYRSGKETEDDNGFLWYPLLCKDCSNINIDGYISEQTYPEGPFFIACDGIRINDMRVSDKENLKGKNIWTTLNLFYCINIEITNSFFYKRNTGYHSGSSINATCRNLIIKKCEMYGGNGLDLSNEWYDKGFISKNVTIENCKIYNSSYGIYTEPTPNLIEHIKVKNCQFKVLMTEKEFGFPLVLGSVKDVQLENCKLSGLIFLQLSGDKKYSGLAGDIRFSHCIFDDNFYGTYSGTYGATVVRNSVRDIDAGHVEFDNCSFNMHKYTCHLAGNVGDRLNVCVKNSRFNIYNLDLSGNYKPYTLQFQGNEVRSDKYYPNIIRDNLNVAIITGNTFKNHSFVFNNTQANCEISDNTFILEAASQGIVIEKSNNIRTRNNIQKTIEKNSNTFRND